MSSKPRKLAWDHPLPDRPLLYLDFQPRSHSSVGWLLIVPAPAIVLRIPEQRKWTLWAKGQRMAVKAARTGASS